MGLFQQLSVLALRQLVGGACKALGFEMGLEALDAAKGFLAERFKDHSRRLTGALHAANERAWKLLEVALAGESFWNWLDRAEDKALRRQVRAFLDALPREQLPAESVEFRRQCLAELRAARQGGLLSGGTLDPQRLAQQAAEFARFAHPRRLLDAEWQVVQGMAEELGAHGAPHLARFLALRPNQGAPLLGLAVRYFFRRAVEEDAKLFQGLAWATWESLAHAQERGFAQMNEALVERGQQLELRLSELQVYVVQIHGAVLDIRDEQQRQGAQHRDLYEAVLNVQRRLDGLAGQRQVQDDLSLRNDEERQLLQAVLARYRSLPPDPQRQLPALLNAIGQLQLLAGDREAAVESFDTVTKLLTDRKALAEAHYHAYRAALDRRDFSRALASYRQANDLNPVAWTVERLRSELDDVQPLVSPEARASLQQAVAQWRARPGERAGP